MGQSGFGNVEESSGSCRYDDIMLVTLNRKSIHIMRPTYSLIPLSRGEEGIILVCPPLRVRTKLTSSTATIIAPTPPPTDPPIIARRFSECPVRECEASDAADPSERVPPELLRGGVTAVTVKVTEALGLLAMLIIEVRDAGESVDDDGGRGDDDAADADARLAELEALEVSEGSEGVDRLLLPVVDVEPDAIFVTEELVDVAAADEELMEAGEPPPTLARKMKSGTGEVPSKKRPVIPSAAVTLNSPIWQENNSSLSYYSFTMHSLLGV